MSGSSVRLKLPSHPLAAATAWSGECGAGRAGCCTATVSLIGIQFHPHTQTRIRSVARYVYAALQQQPNNNSVSPHTHTHAGTHRHADCAAPARLEPSVSQTRPRPRPCPPPRPVTLFLGNAFAPAFPLGLRHIHHSPRPT